MISVHLDSCIFRDHQLSLLFFLGGKAFSFVSLLEELAQSFVHFVLPLCFATHLDLWLKFVDVNCEGFDLYNVDFIP
jgi:hypothetical protein